MKRALFLFLLCTSLYSENRSCRSDFQDFNRSIYSIGDTLSLVDQNLSFDVCHGDGTTNAGESFKFSDLNGNLNGGDYNIILISMNATW